MKDYPTDFLLQLYRTMLRIRETEESFIEPILKQEIRCPVHLYTGEEAVATGVCAALRNDDVCFGSHRSHGHYLAKGGNLNALVAEIYGKETGCCRGRGGSMHVIDTEKGFLGAAPIVAGTIALAVGAAWAAKVKGSDSVAVSFFGDGATDEGVLFESLNFAALYKLPIIFICENNLYSTHLPITECRPTRPIAQITEPFGVRGQTVDGNNVLEVFAAAEQAVQECRNNKGPILIECLTYRMRGHVGPDDNIQGTHTDIRPAEEIEHWQKKDPILQLEYALEKQSVLTETMKSNMANEVADEVKTAHDMARSSPYPNPHNLSDYVFHS